MFVRPGSGAELFIKGGLWPIQVDCQIDIDDLDALIIVNVVDLCKVKFLAFLGCSGNVSWDRFYQLHCLVHHAHISSPPQMSVDCHWSHWSYLQCYCQCRPTLFFLIDQEFYTVHCLQWWFHLRKYSMQPSGTRLLEKRKSTRELEILLCADQGHKYLWTLRRLSNYCTVTYVCRSTKPFWTGKAQNAWNIISWLFQETPESRRSQECQIRVRRSRLFCT